MTRILVASFGVVVLMGTVMAAHHSYAAFDMTRVVEIEGTLEAFEWVSPHSLLKVRSAGVLYSFEWRAPFAMERLGVRRDSFQVGDHLVAAGNPRRDIDQSGVLNLKSVRRPSDGWGWSSGQAAGFESGSNR